MDAGTPWWELEKVLSGLGFAPARWDQPLASLSGGEKTRLPLSKILVTRPDVLLLDEPTNHLDITMMLWAEDWLKEFRWGGHDYGGTIVLVAHDRYLLDRLSDETLVLDGGNATLYPGNYSYVQATRGLARS